MKVFLFSLAKYALLLTVVFNLIAFLTLVMLERSNFYKPEFVKNGLKTKEYDYAVLGSSTGLTTLDTKLMDSLTGQNGINISMDDSALSSHFLMLKHFLALKNKTNTLVLAVTPWDAASSNPSINGNDYRFLPFIREEYVHEYYRSLEKSFFKPLTYSRFLPIIGVSYYNAELFYPAFLAALKPEMMNRSDEKGNYSYPKNMGPADRKEGVMEFSEKNPYLDSIKKMCRQKNIRLIQYLTPMYKTKAASNGPDMYINHSQFLKSADLFADDIHVNREGRKKCSIAFAKILAGSNLPATVKD